VPQKKISHSETSWLALEPTVGSVGAATESQPSHRATLGFSDNMGFDWALGTRDMLLGLLSSEKGILIEQKAWRGQWRMASRGNEGFKNSE
jgi:hypothetical protein